MHPAFPAASSAATVFLVLASPQLAARLRPQLAQAGYHVVGQATTAIGARQQLTDCWAAYVLLDPALPGGDALALATWLAERQMALVPLPDPTAALLALALARERRAYDAQIHQRQQRDLQFAVNNAITHLHDRDELCRTVAAQLRELVPFSLFSLRIGLPEEQAFYWVVLHQSPAGDFEKVSPLQLLGPDAPDELLQRLTEQPPDAVGEQAGVFAGEDFDELCRTQRTAQVSRDAFGVRALVVFPVLLKRHSFTSLQLASPDPTAFTAARYATVELLLPQLALALDNLLVCEEMQSHRHQKAAELALVSAFQQSRELPVVLPALAQALQLALPLDLLTLYGVGPADQAEDLCVVRQPDGTFRPLATSSPPTAATRLAWQQAQQELAELARQPTRYVGAAGTAQRARNLVARHLDEHLGLHATLSVPLPVPGRPTAALTLASRARYAYAARDLRRLHELAQPLALALENLLAFARIEALGRQLALENTYLTEEIRTTAQVGDLIGTGSAMQALTHSLGLVAATDATVLITGETGTGKELVARALHELSARAARTMVKVNCAALPPQLIESELFGHEKGSFTGATGQRLGKFELAGGSTLLLDEIGELPLELQAKLLRVIQEREIERLGGRRPIAVDVRIVAATNRDLKQEVAAGRFRADLYYRLNVFPLAVPPLRERPEDILPLASHFLQRLSKQLGKPLTGLAPDTVRQLLAYSWPGNVRELAHLLERAAILARTPTIALAEPLTAAPPAAPAPAIHPVRSFDDAARTAVAAALAQAAGRVRGAGGAAELLGLKPTTLEARIKKLGLR